tara:strand:+ start:37 stop:321 length:285 start_codon:yes stop_codon:yes gene_type:complete
MSWKDVIADAKARDDWKAGHKNVGKISADLDRELQELQFNQGVVRHIRDIVALKEGYSISKEQRKLIKANIDSYQKLFEEILETQNRLLSGEKI